MGLPPKFSLSIEQILFKLNIFLVFTVYNSNIFTQFKKVGSDKLYKKILIFANFFKESYACGFS